MSLIGTELVVRDGEEDERPHGPIGCLRNWRWSMLAGETYFWTAHGKVIVAYMGRKEKGSAPPRMPRTPPTPKPAPMPMSSDSRTHGYICTCEKSSSRMVLRASPRVGLVLEPAVFRPEPAGRALADSGGEWKTS